MKHSVRVIVAVLALSAPVFAQRSELPTAGLESRIDFWKKIFAQYGKDDIVIHDRFYVHLIYDVADESNVDSKTSQVTAALKEIDANLDTPDTLSPVARQIRESMIASGVTPSKDSLDRLIEGVHTQRGIKERFRDGIIRSGRYVDSFRGVMENHDVLPELALLHDQQESGSEARPG
jgi:membrane-bound lytic murein transglycosylase D